MSMKTFITIYWKGLVIVAFILSFIVMISIDGCRERSVRESITAASQKSFRLFLEDSIKTANAEKEMQRIDSIKADLEKKTKLVADQRDKYKNEASRLRCNNGKLGSRLDSLMKSGTAACTDMLDASLELNDSLRAENKALDSELFELDKEAQLYSDRLQLTEQQLSQKDTVLKSKDKVITQLRAENNNLKCYSDWGEKHKFLKWLFGWKCKK